MLSALKDTHTPPVQVQKVQAKARFCVLESINHFIDCEHFKSQAIFRATHKNFGAVHRLQGNIGYKGRNQVAIGFLLVYVTFVMIIHQRIARIHCCRQTLRVSSGNGSRAF